MFKPTQYCPITEAVSEIIPNCEGQVIPDCEKMLQEEITETSHDITDCWGGGDVRMVGTEAGGVLATITVLPAGLVNFGTSRSVNQNGLLATNLNLPAVLVNLETSRSKRKMLSEGKLSRNVKLANKVSVKVNNKTVDSETMYN